MRILDFLGSYQTRFVFCIVRKLEQVFLSYKRSLIEMHSYFAYIQNTYTEASEIEQRIAYKQ